MGQEINLLSKYPRISRPVEDRGRSVNDYHRRVAREFGKEYFDGGRLFGYGGYYYHPRFWRNVVQDILDRYWLNDGDSILDVGCARGFMLHDFADLLPGAICTGIDISEYAINTAMPDMRLDLQVGSANDLTYPDDSFDLVVSINTVHNLRIDRCREALREIERVSRGCSFITVDAWRTEEERIRLVKWNLTALTFMHVDDWVKLFEEVGYTGDYYWFIP